MGTYVPPLPPQNFVAKITTVKATWLNAMDNLLQGNVPATGTYNAGFVSGQVQLTGPNGYLTSYGDLGFSLLSPGPLGTGPFLRVAGAGKLFGQIGTDAQLPGLHGIDLSISAGDTAPNDASRGGNLLLYAGASGSGVPGNITLQPGTAVAGLAGGNSFVQGGNATAGIAGNIYLSGGLVGPLGGGSVHLIMTDTAGGASVGSIVFRVNSTILWTITNSGALFLGSSGAGLPGQALISNGPNALPAWVQLASGSLLYPPTSLEIAAGIIPANLNFPAYNVLRYGADPTGALDSTYAFQQACLSAYAGWNPISSTFQPVQVTVPSGRYMFAGVATPYKTATVYIRSGMSLIGGGQGTILDLSAWTLGAITADAFRLGWGVNPSNGVATQDPGGQPPEIAELFMLGGPTGGGATVGMRFNGGLVHDIWFAACGLGVGLAGGYVYDCEFDNCLVGLSISGGTNQTVNNCRIFNANVAINFDTSTADISDIIFTSCTIEYPKILGITIGTGTVNIKGVKFVGCDFIGNPTASVTSFNSFLSVGLTNAQIEMNHCTFHNWGQFQSPFTSTAYAVLVQAAGAQVDLKGCIFDGARTNSSYTSTSNAGALSFNQGSVNMTDCVIRNLLSPLGVGISMGGGQTASLQVAGLLYSNIGAASVVNITNGNAASQFVANNVAGDAITPLLNTQSTVPFSIKNSSNWFGGIAGAGGKHFVVVPYQFANSYQVTLRANPNSGGNASYRKMTTLFVEKNNDRAGGVDQSFVGTLQGLQSAGNTNGVLTVVAEFGAVGGGTAIPISNSGVLAISWPNTYANEAIDIQMLL